MEASQTIVCSNSNHDSVPLYDTVCSQVITPSSLIHLLVFESVVARWCRVYLFVLSFCVYRKFPK